MKQLALAVVVALIPLHVFAQTSVSSSSGGRQPRDAAEIGATLGTPTGHEAALSIGHYTYGEPGTLAISIHGLKLGGEYTGVLSLDTRRRWFAQAHLRASGGDVAYDGWCSPFLVTPNSNSPNGYVLDFGPASRCSETGDVDWYAETRAMVGKDVIGQAWALSPYAGVGFRHLSNGTAGLAGYRTDKYLYLPLGLTVRTRVAAHGVLSLNVEYDRLLRGWQTTRDSGFGSGDIPATTTAPGFTIDGFTDVSFAQHEGWALRASAKYQVARHWSVEPSYIHWTVGDSPVNSETVTFTVNRVTARQQIGFYEPFNTTNEFGVKLGFHF